MYKIDKVDLEFLYLGAKSSQGFNEADIARSEAGGLGVGATLDRLGVLRDRGLLEVRSGLFVITRKGLDTFWDRASPASNRILRLLRVKPLEEEQISKYLLESQNAISSELETLRSQGLIMFTTIRKEERIAKLCEITSDGLTLLENPGIVQTQKIELLLSDISQMAKNPDNAQKLADVQNRLQQIKDSLAP